MFFVTRTEGPCVSCHPVSFMQSCTAVKLGSCWVDAGRSRSFTSHPISAYNLLVYSAQILDHFENPRNVGELARADARAQLENPVCGDILQLTLRIADGRIVEVRFRAKGCVPAIACGSQLTELLLGRTLNDARSLRSDDLVEALGGLPQASTHAAHLAIDTLAAALKLVAGSVG